MSVIYVLVPLALVLVGGFVAAFAWATKRGQFDDLETPALRILHDEPGKQPPSSTERGGDGGSVRRPDG
ncbi:MAG: cbb3-type cytochrome oxidase assembly protein CcoS [Gemmatimonadota bacterium]